jgi:cytochrome c oxidase subunit III
MGRTYNSIAPLPIRAHPLVFGVVLFLASELMFFASLFAAYYNLRTLAKVWPPPDVHLDLVEATIGTVILAASSGCALYATRAIDKRLFAHARIGLALTLFLGTIFLLISIHGWLHNDFGISTHAYGSLFYAMTGFHALHVSAGLILLTGLLLGPGARGFVADDRAGAEAISYYWHFVTIVWLGIYGTIYWVR